MLKDTTTKIIGTEADIPEFLYGEVIEFKKTDDDGKKVFTDELLEKIGKDEQSMNNAGYFKDWEKADIQYEAKSEDKSFPWKGACGIRHPMGKIAVHGILARQDSSLFGLSPHVIIKPREALDAGSAENLEDWFQYWSEVLVDLKHQFGLALFESNKKGLAWIKLSWRRDTEHVKIYKEYLTLEEFKKAHPNAKDAGIEPTEYKRYTDSLKVGQPIRIVETYPENIIDCPYPEALPPEDVIFDAKSISWLNTRLSQKINLTWDDIKRGEREGIYKKEDVDNLETTFNSNQAESKDEDDKKSIEDTIFEGFETIEFYDADDDGINERCLFVVIKSPIKVYLRGQVYPYWHQRPHLIPVTIKPRIKEIAGDGIIKLLESTTDELTAIHRQRVDTGTLANARMIKARRAGSFAPQIQEFSVGGVIWLDDIRDMDVINFQPTYPDLFQEEKILEAHAQMITGLSNYHGGREASGDSNAPAAKAIALIREGNVLITRYIMASAVALKEIYFQAFQLFKQNITKDRTYRVLRKDKKEVFGKITRDYFYSRCDIEPRILSPTENPQVEQERAMAIFTMLMQLPWVANDIAIQQDLTSWFIDKANYKELKQKVIISDDAMKQRQGEAMIPALEQMVQQRAMEAVGGEGGIQSGRQNRGSFAPTG